MHNLTNFDVSVAILGGIAVCFGLLAAIAWPVMLLIGVIAPGLGFSYLATYAAVWLLFIVSGFFVRSR